MVLGLRRTCERRGRVVGLHVWRIVQQLGRRAEVALPGGKGSAVTNYFVVVVVVVLVSVVFVVRSGRVSRLVRRQIILFGIVLEGPRHQRPKRHAFFALFPIVTVSHPPWIDALHRTAPPLQAPQKVVEGGARAVVRVVLVLLVPVAIAPQTPDRRVRPWWRLAVPVV